MGNKEKSMRSKENFGSMDAGRSGKFLVVQGVGLSTGYGGNMEEVMKCGGGVGKCVGMWGEV